MYVDELVNEITRLNGYLRKHCSCLRFAEIMRVSRTCAELFCLLLWLIRVNDSATERNDVADRGQM